MLNWKADVLVASLKQYYQQFCEALVVIWGPKDWSFVAYTMFGYLLYELTFWGIKHKIKLRSIYISVIEVESGATLVYAMCSQTRF